MTGAWVAYYPDWSAVVMFSQDDELGALRYAVENHMEVKFMLFGTPLREQT